MDAALMLRRQREQRASWMELDDPPRRALQIRRPSTDQFAKWRDVFTTEASAIESLPRLREIARAVVVGWRGFTEADLLGSAIGAASEQPFATDVFVEWIDDEPKLLVDICMAAVKAFTDHQEQKAAAEKN